MKIVVLDGYGVNPGELTWAGFNALGETTVYDRTSRSDTLERANGADVLLTNKTILDSETIAALPDLRYIGVLATGVNVVDVAAARERNITITNVPAYSTPSAAQATISLLLELSNHTGLHADAVRDGDWTRAKDFCFWKKTPVELDGLTMGLVGFGNIAQRVGAIALALGMKLMVHTRTPKDIPGIRFCGLDELFATADAISLHCPLTDDTKQLVNARTLALMKPTAWLINTARGGLVDEAALATALNDGRLAGAGLDVLVREPPEADNPLLTAANCLITPHIAWATLAARKRLLEAALENLQAYVAGTPRNVVG